MPFSTSLRNTILDHIFSAGAYTPPTTIYIALLTVAMTDYNAGTGGTECTDATYARAAVTNNSTNFPASASGAKSNGAQINFTAFTASATIVGYAIYTASTGATGYMVGNNLTASKTINAGDPIYFGVGDLTLSIT